MIFPAFAVYFNLYFLIPVPAKGRYGWYILSCHGYHSVFVADRTGVLRDCLLDGRTAKDMWAHQLERFLKVGRVGAYKNHYSSHYMA